MKLARIDIDQVLPLRHLVLWPDRTEDFCRISGDEDALHYGAFIDDKLVCVASIFIEGGDARLRKFATLPEYQNQGIGSALLAHILDELKSDHDAKRFWCDARSSATGIYSRFGMAVESEPFSKGGVDYVKMAKRL
ncbi:GNAT family N-acetyltransferase [Gilvimarinus agarilyticus]|uniref:GNAT family N-acetyltransferase n=1 Tax=Gilvimarinus agarilyticus TaxID=679259 RepID=UPI0005A08083|nr:GNAT family N-acetyltransferase [Gilvimarinus agarilyticus]